MREAIAKEQAARDWAAFDAAMAEMGKGTGAWSPELTPTARTIAAHLATPLSMED